MEHCACSEPETGSYFVPLKDIKVASILLQCIRLARLLSASAKTELCACGISCEVKDVLVPSLEKVCDGSVDMSSYICMQKGRSFDGQKTEHYLQCRRDLLSIYLTQ